MTNDIFEVNKHRVAINSESNVSSAVYNRHHISVKIGDVMQGFAFRDILRDYLHEIESPLVWSKVIKIFRSEIKRHKAPYTHISLCDIAIAIENKLAGRKRKRIGKGVCQWIDA